MIFDTSVPIFTVKESTEALLQACKYNHHSLHAWHKYIYLQENSDDPFLTCMHPFNNHFLEHKCSTQMRLSNALSSTTIASWKIVSLQRSSLLGTKRSFISLSSSLVSIFLEQSPPAMLYRFPQRSICVQFYLHRFWWAYNGNFFSPSLSIRMTHRSWPNLEVLIHLVVRLSNGLNSSPPIAVVSPVLLPKALICSLAS